MTQLSIVGYEKETHCQHCGRALVHGIRLDDGRVVGATCLDKKLTKPKMYRGKPYRLGSELIIRAAKVAQFHAPSAWGRFNVSADTLQFDAI